MAPLEQPVRVYPALRQGEDQEIFLARGRQVEMQLRRARERGLGRDFESLREYLDGDDLRDVCWTATARRGQLVTRRYQTERSQAVWIVLDAGRLLRGRILDDAEVHNRRGHSKLDYACSTAVALAQLALFSGDRVGLLVYGQNVQQRVLPGRGHAHLRQIVEALAQARAETSEADHLRATATLNRWQPRRALILWITDLAETAMRPEVIDGAMQLLHRHVLLFVAMAQPDVATAIANAQPQKRRRNVPRLRRAGAYYSPRTAARTPPRPGRASPSTSIQRRSPSARAESIFEGSNSERWSRRWQRQSCPRSIAQFLCFVFLKNLENQGSQCGGLQDCDWDNRPYRSKRKLWPDEKQGRDV